MNKRPAFQFYPADWLKDPDLQICSMTTIGVWINILCRMWEAKEEGILRGTPEELALLAGARQADFDVFLQEAESHRFCDVLHDVTKSDGVVTLICRRMNKAFLLREGAKGRMRKHRGGGCYENVTHPSSSSSSTSSSKNTYMDFVSLTKKEYSKLLEKFGEADLKEKITALNDYLGSKGKKYKSHYHTILMWARKDGPKRTIKKKTKLFPIPGKTCSNRNCRLPAVYKNTSGAYDSYACAGHMPESVKEIYE